jgi:hypothetical protein
LPTERPGQHIQGDVHTILGNGWQVMIAHPPCTYLCVSGLHWNCRRPGRAARTWDAIRFAEQLWDAPIERIAIENPKGALCAFSKLMKATQLIHPYQYGDDASKETYLWLKGLSPLVPTSYIKPRIIDGKERWANQTDSGQNRLTPSSGRAKERSRMYQGIANAMATQWGTNVETTI